MRDFLVTSDGKYLDYSFINSNSELGATNSLPVGKFSPENFNLIFFDNSGRLATIGKYMAIRGAVSREFKGYVKIKDFFNAKAATTNNNNNLANPIRFEYIRNFNALPLINYYDVHQPEAGDKIHLVKRYVDYVDNQYKIKTQVRSFLYPQYPNNSYNNIRYGLTDDILFNNINSLPGYLEEIYTKNIVDVNIGSSSTPDNQSYIRDYFTSVNFKKIKRSKTQLTSLSPNEVNVIEQIMMIYNKLFSSEEFTSVLNDNSILKKIFIKHFEIINDIDFLLLKENQYHNYFTKEYFYNLLGRLREFYYSNFISGIKAGDPFARLPSNLYGYIIGLFNTATLQFLLYEEKIQLLKDFLKGNWFITGRWNPTLPDIKLTEEEVIVKIIESIPVYDINGNLTNVNNINNFMDLLTQKPFYQKASTNSKNGILGMTLYEDLYRSIDPDVIFGGAGTQGRFVDAVYRMWLVSKYNPKTTVSQTLHEYNYTEVDAYWKFEDDEQPNVIDKEAAPRLLPYESEKKLFWYVDNMIFNFYYEGKIQVVKNGYPFGYYHPFQPINFVGTNVETFVNVPFDKSLLTVQNADTITPCDIEQQGRGSNLPIFYAKYIDDIGDKKDTEETVMLIIDVVSIVAGGWGIARRLLAEGIEIAIRKAIITAVDDVAVAAAQLRASTRNLSSLLKAVAVPSIEFVLGTASLVHKVATGGCADYNDCNNTPPNPGDANYDKYQRCQAIEKWLFALEMLTLSGDVIAKKFFRKSTAELNDVLPNNNPFDEITNTQYDDLVNKINTINKIDNEVVEFIASITADYPKIAEKLQDFTQSQKRGFFLDFESATNDVLTQLNNAEGIATQRWQKLFDLKAVDRTKIEALTNEQYYNASVKFYQVQNLANQLNALDYTKRKEFLDNFGTQSDEWFSVLTTKPEAINRWQNLTGRGKQLTKKYPKDWLNVYDNAYTLKTKGEKIPDIEIVALFEQRGLNIVNDVEVEALVRYNNLSSKERRRKVLVAGGKNLDGETILKTNLTKDELMDILDNGKTKYQDYLDTMHPNLKRRVDKIKEFSDFDAGRINYHVDNSVTYPNGKKYDVNQAGNFPGAHAEVQVVNELAIDKWGNVEVSEEVFSNWLKNDVLIYNRNISVKQTETKVIMHTCIDCFNILHEVTFINKFF